MYLENNRREQRKKSLINLDAKPLKTPGGNLISCESQGLALLVQAEWYYFGMHS
jgi:chaperone required for assembly of F1-ATPase